MSNLSQPLFARPRQSLSSQEKTRWLIQASLLWFFIYLILQEQNGWLAETADRIDATWVQLVFLNIPLQLMLFVVLVICHQSHRAKLIKFGVIVGMLNAILILVHIAISIAMV